MPLRRLVGVVRAGRGVSSQERRHEFGAHVDRLARVPGLRAQAGGSTSEGRQLEPRAVRHRERAHGQEYSLFVDGAIERTTVVGVNVGEKLHDGPARVTGLLIGHSVHGHDCHSPHAPSRFSSPPTSRGPVFREPGAFARGSTPPTPRRSGP